MTERFADGFAYPECPRWHDGALWFSDQHAGEVIRVDAAGSSSVVHRVPSRPSGLGWRPDGSVLVVSMLDHCLLCDRDGELLPIADFTSLHGGPTNDMVVDEFGRAYIGNIGFDFYAGESARPTVITMVDTDDRVSVVTDDVVVPNGMVITSQHELVFAESWRHQLTRFAIADDGSLHDREVFADVGTDIPDGICIDAEDAIWYASLHDRFEVVRVSRGGRVLDRVKTSGEAIACELGGADGYTLFVCVSDDLRPETSVTNHTGRIECARVDVPRRGH